MSAIVFGIKHYEIHDGDGIRSTVFLKGCPLRCLWCHNPEGISEKVQIGFYAQKCLNCGECMKVCKQGAHFFNNSIHEFDRSKCIACGKCALVCSSDALIMFGKNKSANEIAQELLEDKGIYEATGGGVTISGGEPLLHSEFCVELCSLLEKSKINIALDTSLYSPWEKIEPLVPLINTFLVDIKAIEPELHKKLTGVDNTLIIDNIKKIDGMGKAIEIRIPFIPTLNEDTTYKSLELLKSLKNLSGVKILPYHDYAKDKYSALGIDYILKDLETISNDSIDNYRNILRRNGIKVVEE